MSQPQATKDAAPPPPAASASGVTPIAGLEASAGNPGKNAPALLVYTQQRRSLEEMIGWMKSTTATDVGGAAPEVVSGADAQQLHDAGLQAASMRQAKNTFLPPLSSLRAAAASRYPSYLVFIPSAFVVSNDGCAGSTPPVLSTSPDDEFHCDFVALCRRRFGTESSAVRKRVRVDTTGDGYQSRSTFYCPPFSSGLIVSVVELEPQYAAASTVKEDRIPVNKMKRSGGANDGAADAEMDATNPAIHKQNWIDAKKHLHASRGFELLNCVACSFRSQYRVFRPVLEAALGQDFQKALRGGAPVSHCGPPSADLLVQEWLRKESRPSLLPDPNATATSSSPMSELEWHPFDADPVVLSLRRLAAPGSRLLLWLSPSPQSAGVRGLVSVATKVSSSSSGGGGSEVESRALPTFLVNYYLHRRDNTLSNATASEEGTSAASGWEGKEEEKAASGSEGGGVVQLQHEVHWTEFGFTPKGCLHDGALQLRLRQEDELLVPLFGSSSGDGGGGGKGVKALPTFSVKCVAFVSGGSASGASVKEEDAATEEVST